jgi:hypothetical protein
MILFVALLLVGYVYVLQKGAFDWGERARREAQAEARALTDLRKSETTTPAQRAA